MMIFFRAACLLLFVVSLLTTSPAQKPVTSAAAAAPETRQQLELKEKALQLLSETIEDAASLKLTENRILVSSIAAGLYWDIDQKKARRLIQAAAAELQQLQTLLEQRAESNPRQAYYWRIINNMLRQNLLSQISQKDPQLALSLCYSTRPPELENAVRQYQQLLAQTGTMPNLSGYKEKEREELQNAVQEIELEQQINKAIARDDPEKLAANINEMIKRDANVNQILTEIDNLNLKDHELAQKLLDQLVERMLGAMPPSDMERFKGYAAYIFFTRYQASNDDLKKDFENSIQKNDNKKNVRLTVDQKTIVTLANQAFDQLLEKDSGADQFRLVENVIYLRKVLPKRFPEIKAKYEAAKATSGLRDWAEDDEAREELGESPSFEQIIKNAGKLRLNSRTEYYRKSIARLLETGGAEKTRQLLAQIPDQKDRENALDYINAASSDKNIKQENLSEAKQAIGQIKSVAERSGKLIALAAWYHNQKTAESQKIAEDALNEASGLVSTNAATATQMEALLPVVRAYAVIQPQKVFEIAVPIIERSNQLIDAYVLLSSYDDLSYPYVSENEIVFGAQDSYYSYKGRYSEILTKLAAHDFAWTKRLIETFSRRDVQIIAKLSLVESLLTQSSN